VLDTDRRAAGLDPWTVGVDLATGSLASAFVTVAMADRPAGVSSDGVGDPASVAVASVCGAGAVVGATAGTGPIAPLTGSVDPSVVELVGQEVGVTAVGDGAAGDDALAAEMVSTVVGAGLTAGSSPVGVPAPPLPSAVDPSDGSTVAQASVGGDDGSGGMEADGVDGVTVGVGSGVGSVDPPPVCDPSPWLDASEVDAEGDGVGEGVGSELAAGVASDDGAGALLSPSAAGGDV
jgi:hypothetical protein